MRVLQLIGGAVVPHAPLLLEALNSPETADAAANVQAAVQKIDVSSADVVAVVSPHGRATGTYDRVRGSLARFGFPEIVLDLDGDRGRSRRLFPSLPLLSEEVDHGILVPTLLLDPPAPPIAIGFREVAQPRRADVENEVERVVSSLQAGGDLAVFVVASANTAAGLSPRAPLTELEAAKVAEERFLEALERDVGGSTAAVMKLWTDGGSCSPAPLLVFAALFAGRRAEVLAHESPVGVGYTVAVAA